jgi:hypothetical protein
MKFSALATLALGATLKLSEAGSVDIYKNFLGSDEIAYFSGHDIDKHSGVSCDTRTYGVAKVNNGLLGRIHKTTGHEEAPFEDQGRRSVLLSTIRQTTGIHLDHTYDENGNRDSTYDNKVFLMFLNTNEKAKFVHGTGEDRIEVPAEAGTMIAFDGGVPHNAELEGGTMTLLGAHGLDGRVALVGDGSTNCYEDKNECGEDQKCVCDEKRLRRALREIRNSHNQLRANFRASLRNDLDVAHNEVLEEQEGLMLDRNLSEKKSKSCDVGTCVAKSVKSDKKGVGRA